MRFLVIILILFSIPRASALPKTVRLGADEWCPYNCKPDSKKPGILVELAKMIFEASQIHVEYVLMPWTRAIEEGRNGKLDGILGALKEEADDYIYPTEAPIDSANEFLVRANFPWSYSGVDSLRKIALGVVQGYAYGEPVDSYLKENQGNKARVQFVSGENALELNLKKLEANRIDAVVEDRMVLSYLRAKGRISNVVSSGGTANSYSLYVAFSPKSIFARELAERFSEGVVELKRNGKFKKIVSSYLGDGSVEIK